MVLTSLLVSSAGRGPGIAVPPGAAGVFGHLHFFEKIKIKKFVTFYFFEFVNFYFFEKSEKDFLRP